MGFCCCYSPKDVLDMSHSRDSLRETSPHTENREKTPASRTHEKLVEETTPEEEDFDTVPEPVNERSQSLKVESEPIDPTLVQKQKLLGILLRGGMVTKFTRLTTKHPRYFWVPSSHDRLNWGIAKTSTPTVAKGSLPFEDIFQIKTGTKGPTSLFIKSSQKNLTLDFEDLSTKQEWADALELAVFQKGFQTISMPVSPENIPGFNNVSIKRLQTGNYFVKNYKDQSAKRFFYLARDVDKICWTTEEKFRSEARFKGSIQLKEIKSIEPGPSSSGKFTFTIVKTNAKQLELVSEDKSVRDQWVSDLRNLI